MRRLLQLTRAFCSVPTPKPIYRFQYASSLEPHPEKAHKGGEDALFASDHVLAVADGVGGWADQGIDPGLYSKRLMKIFEELLEKDRMKYINDPKSLVVEAVGLNKQKGTTTVCLLTLHPETGLVKAYYLGDSVFAVLSKEDQRVRIASDQQYQFNFPVQVGTGGQNPAHGMLFELDDVTPGDIIVVATDGIWDNVPVHMISQIRQKEISLQDGAKFLTGMAKQLGMSPDFESPFYLKAKAANINFPPGGKLDDNAAIVATIIKEEL